MDVVYRAAPGPRERPQPASSSFIEAIHKAEKLPAMRRTFDGDSRGATIVYAYRITNFRCLMCAFLFG